MINICFRSLIPKYKRHTSYMLIHIFACLMFKIRIHYIYTRIYVRTNKNMMCLLLK